MNGKTMKVVEYNLSYGANDRTIHVLGLFRYKPNNNIYIIYSDVDIQYNIIYYGSSHIKETTILSMACKDKQEEEIMKEYIFKTINHEQLDNFEIFSLENINGLEIISSNKIEVKPEVLYQLIEETIPKPKVQEENPTVKTTPKKKSFKKIGWLLILFVILGIVVYFVIGNIQSKDTTGKTFTCTKTYQHETLSAKIEEENTYYFNYQEVLEKLSTNTIYQFQSKDAYQDFIKNGTMYRYMPEDTNGGWDKNDEEYWFKVMTNETVTSSYKEPKTYEEAYNYYKNKGYTCNEKIGKE